MNELTDPEIMQFKVSSGLKSIIGRDLITNDFVAIFELVKNSADAGATRIDIIYEESGNEKKLFIVDNGKGMSKEDIEDKWLFVAYSAKKDGSEDHKEKIYAGNKGIGRFSCDRLGTKLVIQSKPRDQNFVSVLNVDWGDFEKSPKEWFTKIDIKYSTSNEFELPSAIRTLNHGLIICVSDLREPESWDRTKLISLKRSLVKLVDPFGDSSSKIEINIHAATEYANDERIKKSGKDDDFIESNIVNGPVLNRLIDLLNEKTTKIEVKLEDGFYYSTLIDRGELIYKIREKIKFGSNLTNTSFLANVFFLNRSAKSLFVNRMGLPSVQFGSLFLFRNGFRVHPIGEQGDDFWGLEYRKQQGTARYLSGRDILGKIDIIGPETKFKESSSRDLGLIKTPASEELKEIIFSHVIRRLEGYVVGVTWEDALDKDYDSPERMFLDDNKSKIISLIAKLSNSKDIEVIEYSKNIVNSINEKSSNFLSTIEKLGKLASSSKNSELLALIDEAKLRFEEDKKHLDESLKIAKEEIEARKRAEQKIKEEQEKREAAEKEKHLYKSEFEREKGRNLFLTIRENKDKDQLESFIHQIIIYASATKDLVDGKITSLAKLSVDSIPKQDVIDLLSDLLQTNEKIITTSRFATTAAFTLDSAQIDDDLALYINEYCEKIITSYHNRINVSCNRLEKGFVRKFSPIEIGMVLDNIVVNAIKARATTITINLSLDMKDILIIEIIDNGRGINKEIIDKNSIFEKGYTTTDGSGLGLYHAKKQLLAMGGEISLSYKQPERGASFLIRIKK